jgi:endonuclease/exonuclease/phosphatase family metal-dependent hydrolase
MIPIRACVLLALALSTTCSAQKFRVITSNLWFSGTKGFNYRNGIYPLGRYTTWPGIKTYMKRAIPWGYGIIGLQEVDYKTKRTGGLNVSYDLVGTMGWGWTHRFGATQGSNGGTTGNSVLTNAKVVKVQYWKYTFNPASPVDYGSRQRGAVALKLDFNGKRLWFVNTHLEPSNRFALAQVFQLLGRVKTFDPDTPVIVVGDMNIMNGTGKSATEQTYYRMAGVFDAAGFVDISYKKATRIPGAAQAIPIADGQLDYIFVYDRHARLTVHSCRSAFVMSYPNIFTDHLAVIADFEWK